jgi:hypothetical protein
MTSWVICEGSSGKGFRWLTAVKKISAAASSAGRPRLTNAEPRYACARRGLGRSVL